MDIRISPSILSADFGNLREEALASQRAGGSDIHIDIMDGHYVHNFSFGMQIMPALKRELTIPLVAHLEIDNPDAFIPDFAAAGSDMIVVQEDTCPNLPRTVRAIRDAGVRAGIGLNPDRGFEKLEANPEILGDIDLLIIMAVYPGFGGQPFSPAALPKIRRARTLRDEMGLGFDIGVDGAVGVRTIPGIVRAGGNYLIAGSSVFVGDIERNIADLDRTARQTLSI